MYKTKVFFKTLTDVKEFVDIAAKYDDLEINLISDIYTMNAHSIIGILSLDISAPIELEIPTGPIPESFYDDISRYLWENNS